MASFLTIFWRTLVMSPMLAVASRSLGVCRVRSRCLLSRCWGVEMVYLSRERSTKSSAGDHTSDWKGGNKRRRRSMAGMSCLLY